jgi:hypothetical protein
MPPVFDPQRAQAHPPFGLYFRRYAPFDTFGFGFEGDKRSGPSTSLKDTSRTYGCLMFNRAEVFYWFAGTSGTHRDTLLWGRITGFSNVRMNVIVRPGEGPGRVDFTASTAGNMPLLPKTPDIDTRVSVLAEFRSDGVRIFGTAFGDTFPNLEVFLLCYRSGRTALLMDGRTSGGRNTGPLTRLPGAGVYLGFFDRQLKLDGKGELAMNYTTFATDLPG